MTRRSAAATLGAGVAAACGALGSRSSRGAGASTAAPVTIRFARWDTPAYYERNL